MSDKGMDWNLDLGEEENAELTNELLDELTPLPLDDFDVEAKNNKATTGEPSYERRISMDSTNTTNHRNSEQVGGQSQSRRVTRKRPKGFPKPPLSAYNIFFQKQRPAVMNECSQRLVRGELGKAMGQKWRSLGDEERKVYEKMAEEEIVRYRTELKAYREARRKQNTLYSCDLSVPPIRSQSSPSSPPRPKSEEGALGPGGPPQEFSVISPSVSPSLPPQARIPKRQKPIRCLEASNDFPSNPKRVFDPFRSLDRHVYSRSSSHRSSGRYNMSTSTRPDFTIPAGAEVFLPDEHGREQKYRVHYECYRMTKKRANEFIHRMMTESQGRIRQFKAHRSAVRERTKMSPHQSIPE